jgi:hypothetical protein
MNPNTNPNPYHEMSLFRDLSTDQETGREHAEIKRMKLGMRSGGIVEVGRVGEGGRNCSMV